MGYLFISLKLWLGFTTWPMRFLNPLSPFSAENSIFIEIPSERRGIELVQLETVSDPELHALTSRPPLPPIFMLKDQNLKVETLTG